MKLIIDIPEEIYKASQIIKPKYDDVIQIPLEVIANGTPLSEKLEKIKVEIIEYRDNEANDIDFEIGAINDIIAIIEKYISGKGE